MLIEFFLNIIIGFIIVLYGNNGKRQTFEKRNLVFVTALVVNYISYAHL